MFTTPLAVLGVVVESVRRYGIVGLFAKKKPRHAAKGRARRQNFPVTDHRVGRGELSTMQAVEQLIAKRTGYALAA